MQVLFFCLASYTKQTTNGKQLRMVLTLSSSIVKPFGRAVLIVEPRTIGQSARSVEIFTATAAGKSFAFVATVLGLPTQKF